MRKFKLGALVLGAALVFGAAGCSAFGEARAVEVGAADTTATWTASAQGFSDQEQVGGNSYTFDDSKVTISFSEASGNGHKYYNNGTAVRSYGSNSFTIATSAGKLKSITLSNNQTKEVTADVGTYSANNWSGNAASVTFTVDSGSGNFRTSTITAVYDPNGGGGQDPVLQNITISNEKTAYTVGDEFVKPTVTANYDIGDPVDVTASASCTGYNMGVAGEYTVTVSYGGKSAEYSITVSAAEPTGDVLYSADFTTVATHSYTQNKTFTLNEKEWVASVSQVNGSVFYLGCNSTHTAKGILNDNANFADVVTALADEDSTYNSNKATAHAYALKLDNAYENVGSVEFTWAGGNNAFQVYLFGDKGDGYELLNHVNYATSGTAVSGSLTWNSASGGVDFEKFAIVARPGATGSTATNKTLRVATFQIIGAEETAELTGIDIVGDLETTTYTVGDAPSTAGLSVVGHYNGEPDKTLTTSITASPTTLSTIGNNIKVTFSASHGGFDASVDKYVTVKDIEVTPISSFYDGTIDVGESATESTYYIQGTVIAIESNSYYIQDGQYGLLVYGGKTAPATGMKIGDLVRIQSKVINYKGYVMETSGIVGDPTCEIIGTGNLPAAPVITTVAQLTDANQSTRITFNGLKLSSAPISWTKTWSQGSSEGVATVKAGENNVIIYVSKYLDSDTGSSIVSKLATIKATDTFDLFQAVKAISTSDGSTQISISNADQVVIHTPEEDPIIGWINSYMEMDNPDFEGDGTMMCRDQSYYVNAKAALKALEQAHAGSIAKFEADAEGDYAGALARYKAWAKACGDKTPFDGEATIVNAIHVSNTNITTSGTNMIAIIVILSVALVSSTGAVTAIIIKKRTSR